MSVKRDRQVLERMLRHCERLMRSVPAGLPYDVFISSEEKQDACVHNVGQLGELAKEQLSDECKQRLSDVPWNLMIRTRHKLVHHYDDYKPDLVYRIVTDHVPQVYAIIKQALKEDYGDSGVHKMNLK